MNSYNLVRDRQKRVIKPPQRYGHAELTAFALTVAEEIVELDPRSYQEAMGSKEADKWLLAMQEEMESLNKNKTWVLVTKLEKQKLIGSKWIYKRKEGIPGVEDPRYKARSVAKGFT